MSDLGRIVPPPKLSLLKEKSRSLGFNMACEDTAGALLRALAASKRGGRLLELGTGTGVGTSWLLDGMDQESKLITVDSNFEYQQVAREAFTGDWRLEIVACDAAEFLAQQPAESFDLVFADAVSGKFFHLDESLAAVKRGGFYVVDDLLPQENWPTDHAPKVKQLIEKLASLTDFRSVPLTWSSGIMLLVRI